MTLNRRSWLVKCYLWLLGCADPALADGAEGGSNDAISIHCEELSNQPINGYSCEFEMDD